MTNDRLQAFLAQWSGTPLPLRLGEAEDIVRWTLSDGGPIALADRAAWELISSECRCVEIEGVLWWESPPFTPGLGLDEDEAAYQEEVAHAQQYLVARQLLIQHPCHQSLMRLPT